FKVDIDVVSDLEGILYLGTSKFSMLKEFEGTFAINKYTFVVTGLSKEKKYYFYVKNTSVNESGRTGIYSKKTTEYVPPPVPIDIGSEAVEGNNGVGNNKTIISKINPANATGTITKIEIYPRNKMSNVKVATFTEVSPGVFTTRDYEVIGTVTAGAKRTFVVNIDVVEGDFIGFYSSSGSIQSKTPFTGSVVKIWRLFTLYGSRNLVS
ncbi:unnamed protein product, partial [marine sediment metagenome]